MERTESHTHVDAAIQALYCMNYAILRTQIILQIFTSCLKHSHVCLYYISIMTNIGNQASANN